MRVANRGRRGISLLYFEVSGPFKIVKEDKGYVACFPSLNITSQGRTESEAKKMLIDAIKNVIEVCFERGTLNDYLKKHNYSVVNKDIRKNLIRDDEDIINIPIYLMNKSDKNTGYKTC